MVTGVLGKSDFAAEAKSNERAARLALAVMTNAIRYYHDA